MTNPEGVTINKSKYGVKETIDRLQQFLQQHGATIYARINQQQELSNAGQAIAPMEFLLFGNPKAGGPVIVESPIAALDLPLKILAWQDAQQTVWVAYNNVGYIKNRYALSTASSAPLNLEPLIAQILIQ
ncbi:DUF302 domain-containing protein [Mucilaginibacter sp. SP1R1]|uniref:DUF302 domain-containing protein n=1 Tax=Mucilaginibacter sp. SP1R1 TaxID=2723091 RepID=UPI0017AB3D08|nr:DUF302 domain-containing protein [Mucilaginibacter sp. SP1R1]MBB6147971.1 uncharacterized protein (DUF302 family) [Mucilaginibacter sp. SP1R1]